MDNTNEDEFMYQFQAIEDDFMLSRISSTEAVNKLVSILGFPYQVAEETVIDWLGG